MTVYEFAKKLMNDEEYNRGGVPRNERKYLDAIGFSYTVESGQVESYGDDLRKFYEAMETLCTLHRKYAKKA